MCVASLATRRAFATFTCAARTIFKEIILNLNLMEKEERKRTVLASSKKRAEISIDSLLCCYFNIFLCVFNVFFYIRFVEANLSRIKKIFLFEIPVKRNMLCVSPANNILIIQP